MTITLDQPVLQPVLQPDVQRTTVAALLADRLAVLGERIHRDGLDAHAAQVRLVAEAVRPTSAVLADVLTGGYVAPMRERAFDRACRLVLLRPARHADLAVALA
jgi:hypothetical protein